MKLQIVDKQYHTLRCFIVFSNKILVHVGCGKSMIYRTFKRLKKFFINLTNQIKLSLMMR